MTDRATIAAQTAASLRDFASRADQTPILIGFDGFVDSIIQVVDQRQDENAYQPIPTIENFGQRISAVAGKSANFELVKTLEKLGGNGPIMANALACAGVDVTYIGCTGHPATHPAFEELASRAYVLGVADPGLTDALEFNDGKLMLGKYDHVGRLGWNAIEQAIGRDTFKKLATQSKLIGTINWTMMPHIEGVWNELRDEILPPSPEDSDAEKPYLFVDLADPAKHTPEAIASAVKLAATVRSRARVVLGMNLGESTQVARALGLAVPDDPEGAIEQTARAIREALDLHAAVVHPRRGAAAARELGDGSVESATFAGPFVTQPKLSTGAGDNFNAGFCLGLLADLSLEQCLCTGTGTSGYYVREARSPALEELAAFCDELPQPATA